MNFIFHPEALEEYFNAITYYSKISKDTASNFVKNIEQGINQILEFPKSSRTLEQNIRRYTLNKYPFCIYYELLPENVIMIYAVMHTSRKPNHWKSRK